jgi:Patatin-like phospholipase
MDPRRAAAEDPLPLWRVLEDEFRELHASGTASEWRQRWQSELDRIALATPGGAPRPAQLESVLQQLVHDLPNDDARTALCLSGGGIRSASFGLGVLQGLARRGLLSRFHYLSTVSGGGYIGSWLSSWIHRHPDGLAGAERELADSVAAPAEPGVRTHPVQQLRRYSNYLSPRTGLFSTDTWTLVATFLRNLLANWLVLIPWLLLLLLLPRVVLSLAGGVWFSGIPVSLWLLLLVVAAAWVCCLFAVKYTHDTDEAPRPEAVAAGRTAEVTGEFLRECLIPVVSGAVLLVIALAWYRAGRFPPDRAIGRVMVPTLLAGGGLFGASAHWAGWLWSNERRESVRDDLGLLGSGLLAGLGGGFAAQMALRLPDDPMWLVGYVWLAPAMLLGLFVLGSNLHAAWAGINNRTSDADMEWTARMSAYILRSGTLWLLASGVVYYGPVLFDLLPRVVSLSGVAALFGSSVVSGWSGSTESGRRSEQPARGSRVLDLFTRVAGPAFLLVILAWLTALTSLVARSARDAPWAAWAWGQVRDPGGVGVVWRGTRLAGLFDHLRILCELNLAGVLALAALLGGLFWFCASNVALNKFSLHHMYRERLIRAFLGACRRVRRPDPFTGFDPDDNLPVGLLWPMALTPATVRDPAAFLRELRDGDHRVAQAVKSRLPDPLAGRIAAWADGADPGPILNDFCREFDLQTLPLGQVPSDQLSRADIPAHLQGSWDELAKASAGGPDLYKVRLFNRLLLEDAFSAAIRGARPGHGSRPLHLINMTLNLTSDEELAWQDRKGESFTVSALHAGAGDPTLGYRRTDFPAVPGERRYGGERGISLGTAMAISGAAASPNMGYHSSPVITFLLTLFNARLGWWLGNPGPPGKDTFQDYYVRGPVRWLLRELRGKTGRTAEYVYLSDGGHFENLGLYEVVRRRCRFVVVSDAGCDPEATFEDLGNAIRKIRIDMGIAIDFQNGLPIYSRAQAAEGDFPMESARHYALGTIRYSEVDQLADGRRAPDGILLYLKPAVYGREPVDVRNYATKHREFPHETTADQWFSEPQLESYRALGLYVVDRAFEKVPSFDSVGAALRQVEHPVGRLSGEWQRAL